MAGRRLQHYLAVIIDANEHHSQYTLVRAASPESARDLVATKVDGFSALHIYPYASDIVGKTKKSRGPKIDLKPARLCPIAKYAFLHEPVISEIDRSRLNAIPNYITPGQVEAKQ